MRLAIQLYTLRSLGSPVELIEMVGEHDEYEGVQFARLESDADTDAVGEALADAGLAVAGAHVGLEAIEADPEGVGAFYDRLGSGDLVVPSYDREAFESADGAREAGDRLATLADRLPEGASLHYHNHTFEFTPTAEGTTFDDFAAAADGVDLEVDTGLANHAGEDPVELIERYGDRVSLLHLTDSRPEEEDAVHVDLGEGTVDIPACIDAAEGAGVEWVIFEHGLTDDPVASMEGAAETLDPLL